MIPYALGTFSQGGGASFAAFVFDRKVVDIAAVRKRLTGEDSRERNVDGLLEDWARSFDALSRLAERVKAEGLDAQGLDLHSPSPRGREPVGRGRGGKGEGGVHALPTIMRPSKILNCAANYSGHLAEMRKYTQTGGGIDPNKIFKGDKSRAEVYLFLKAPSSLTGAYDDIVMPAVTDQIDWEAELAVAIGPRSRHVKADRALETIAGYMIFNDVSCRNRLWREDRPNFRTDWLTSKSYDTFGPLGPIFVPRPFLPYHGELRLTLKVNGETKQDGFAGEMIYSPEEQIEYASRTMTLEPGDVFATGTLAGVGQGTGTYLKPGDVVETTIAGLGMQRNPVVAPRA